jgi:probable HAF family extracellular repeat protein
MSSEEEFHSVAVMPLVWRTRASTSSVAVVLILAAAALSAACETGSEVPVEPATLALSKATIAASYQIIDLGTQASAVPLPTDVSRGGTVVGGWSGGGLPPFRWTASTGIDLLGTTPGSAHAINDHGQVVGSAVFPNTDGDLHPFFWSEATGIIDLGILPAAGCPCEALGVNNRGEVVGYSDGGNYHAFRWTANTGLTAIQSPDFQSIASGIDRESEIVVTSSSQLAFIGERVFQVKPPKPAVDIPPPVPVVTFVAQGTSDRGEIIGSYEPASPPDRVGGFVWSRQLGMRTIDTDPGLAVSPLGINNHGLVVGVVNSLTGGTSFPFFWSDAGGLVDATSLLGVGSVPVSVNDDGWIVGLQFLSPTSFRGVVWVPSDAKVGAARVAPLATTGPSKLIRVACFRGRLERVSKAALVSCLADGARSGQQ